MMYRGNRSNCLDIKQSISPYIPLNTSSQRCIQEAVNEVSSAILLLIQALQQIYERFSIGFLVKKQYIHKVIMSMIAPVQIKIQYDLGKTQYFSEMTPVNQVINTKEPSPITKKNNVKNEEKGLRKNQSQVLDKSYIIKQFRQDLENISKLKNETKSKLIQKLQQKIKRKQESQLIKSQIIDCPDEQSMINESNCPNQQSKYQIISKWIKEETKTGKLIKKQKLLDKVKEINKDDDMKNANAWLQDYFSVQKQIVDHLTLSGNSHLLNLRIKTAMQDQEEETLKMMVSEGQILGKSSESSYKLGEGRVKFRYQ